MTLEELLRMEIDGTSSVSGDPIKYSPHFTVSVQKKSDDGVQIIIHADGHNSETLDFVVNGNNLREV